MIKFKMSYTNIQKIIMFPLFRFQFKKFGFKSIIKSPFTIKHKNKITIGRKVKIDKYSWFIIARNNNGLGEIIVEDGVSIGPGLHIVALGQILIKENALLAKNVFISDNLHGYENINKPISHQELRHIKNIVIGSDSWIGENACIIGANIGIHSIVGANAVVTKDVPDYAVVVGNPASVIKKYSFVTNSWEEAKEKI